MVFSIPNNIISFLSYDGLHVILKTRFIDKVSMFRILYSSSFNDLTLSPKNDTDYFT